MIKMRLIFEKTGRAVYISHLDLMHVFQTAFQRAEIPLWYTEGFNPHPYISLPMPLPVGVASLCEILDFQTENADESGDWCQRLTAVLPEGLCALRPCDASQRVKDITAAGYRYFFRAQKPQAAADALSALFDRPSIEVVKRTKSGEKTIDLKAQIASCHVETAADGVLLTLRAVADGQTIYNPLSLYKAIPQQDIIAGIVEKFAIYTKNGVFAENKT